MSQLTTYTIKSKTDGFIWLFKYHLNGALLSFEILDGQLSPKQIKWLFSPNFPASEADMMQQWLTRDMKSHFEVIKTAPILDFENLWEAYGPPKVKKELCQKAFNKLTPGEQVKCFLALKPYAQHLKNTGQARAHLVTWINQKRFNDEY